MARIERYLLLTLTQLFFQFSHGERQTDFFRADYKYLEEMQSYYKIHTLRKTWDNAKRKCSMEGAQLWFPLDNDEADTVLRYLNETQYLCPYVYVGISSRFVRGSFRTIDGTAVRDIYNIWAVGEPNDITENSTCVVLRNNGYYYDDLCTNMYPFICRKNMRTLTWNKECNVPFRGYEYNKELRTCYKLHLKPLTWRDAFEACDDELSYLAIVNSEEESKYLINITENAPNKVYRALLKGQIHLGFSYDSAEEDWKTIMGESLEQAGYNVWDQNQTKDGENEKCGSMFYNGTLNDMGCYTHKCYYICEKEKTIRDILDERSGRI